MQLSLLEYIRCPECEGALELRAEAEDGPEVMQGTLACNGCTARYPVVRGVPRMNVRMEGLQSVADSFGFEWKAHHKGEMEDETVFGRSAAEDWQYLLDGLGIVEEALDGKLILDGGCGSARLTKLMASRPGSVVIGVDVNEAVDEAYAYTRDRPNVHIVQGNIFHLPFSTQLFDVVWSNGVIHHTPDAAAAHRSLSKHVAPSGRMFIWVYAKRFSPFKFTKDIFDVTRLTRLPLPWLMRISKVFSYISWVMLQVYRAIRSVPGLRPRDAWGARKMRRRTIRELQLTWLDTLSPEYDTLHTEEEVIGWFEREGFENIGAIEEPKVGVRGTAPQSAAGTA